MCVGYQKYSTKELLTVLIAKIGYVCLIKDYLYMYIIAMIAVLLLSPLDFMLSLVQHQFTNIDVIVYLVITFIDDQRKESLIVKYCHAILIFLTCVEKMSNDEQKYTDLVACSARLSASQYWILCEKNDGI